MLPIIGVLFCFLLLAALPWETWVRFVVWLLIGLVIYFTYSRRHARTRTGEATDLPSVEQV